MPDIKLGSLFDGIGVFPLAASRCGIRPVWASEIEKAPISITKRHFPDMVHLGDITKVDGGKIPPVHVITFGSPCQNLSLIGNRSGLAGAKSSLFYQAFRIIQEMRDAINEGAARRAKEMNSFSDYKEGSATAEYRAMVDKAAAIAEQQKSRVDPMYHEKIDHLLDTYARKLAENMNQGFVIDARVPSVMIAGPANFPVGKKEKQNRARDSNMEEWRYIQGLLDKIRSTGMGGISADDPAAIEKLQKKLDGLERSQLIMKEVNAYYRKHGKLDGCALLSPDQIEKLKASMASSWRSDPRPFESYQLTNNNAEIRRVKARIKQLSKQAQQEFSGWEFDGGRVEMNREDNRLQVFFDGKPDADTRAELKSSGFRWAPSVGAWQRQLTDNAIRAADRLECIKPLSGEKPSQLQKKPSILQTMREQDEKVQTEPEKKAPSGRDAER